MTYRYLPDRPAEPTPEFLREQHGALSERIAEADAADTPDAWIGLFDDWNALMAYVHSEGSRRRLAFDADTRDEAAEARFDEFRRTMRPVAEDGDRELAAALAESPHAGAVGRARGERLLALLQLQRERLDPRNAALRIEADDVAQEWDRLVSAATVSVRGEEMTIPKARSLDSSPDAELRREAFLAWRGWFRDHRDALQDIYSRLVDIRHRMALNLGDSSFVRLGHVGMRRTDYGAPEIAAFREAVRRHVAPLHAALCHRQAELLGTPTLKPWDAGFDPDAALPTDAAEPVATQPERVQAAFESLSPRLASHFRRMRERELIDLENRPGKRPGAYCTLVPDEDVVAIFCNSVGSADDIRTLVHEAGHAFQGWESRWIEAVELRTPSFDAAEVHSMGMELLITPHLDGVLAPEHLDAFRGDSWRRGVEILTYCSIVDGFQHWVYENPAATPDERDAEWIRLSEELMPGIDWEGHEDLLAARWLAQLHVFHAPFYYIDYALAQCGALQLARWSESDPKAALDAYLELCRLGGTKSVLELFAAADLRSPLDPDLVEDLAGWLAGKLGLEPEA